MKPVLSDRHWENLIRAISPLAALYLLMQLALLALRHK